ncbi:hypothetical protein Q4603_11395 [Zobellia galactanivorans]|uniref:Conserved hypothetical lipoprotein n=1 Tax=Zobellia galactanivorans (strain DSM 12802 / CCUG 47099 / CIP 106680 / NCIMB 13871 / Dsij) TaxID=63186 RepID=G0LB80_ZOBGA|nr:MULTISPECIES: hypothetical protein [Zobellia]MBU3026638.1 hypothetical protein [Zobellia galactanivorans]MDO6809222.1 hypothetical protein [Zobellia galactanivorans]OWW26870.1 hypothetical protein B4Q04_04095 [Zobellia sp. OII3]CAZ95853.1 Conserved hypothetical lipoprotein [Zobellia galactanivorans]
MKRIYLKLLTIAFTLAIASCSLDDDGTNFQYAPLEITGASLPDTFELGRVYSIDVKILRPDDCTLVDRFDVSRSFTDSTQIRTVSAVGIILDKEKCNTVDDEVQDSFQFEVLYDKPYVFKFYKGNDDQGEPEFLEIEVPVSQKP